MPLWFDLVLILSFAWNGLILGFVSLYEIQEVFFRLYSKAVGWAVTIASIILSSFGIYLGRYLRWNSWDIVKDPHGLFTDLVNRIINPSAHAGTYGLTIFFSLFLIIGYVMVHQLLNINRVIINPESRGENENKLQDIPARRYR